MLNYYQNQNQNLVYYQVCLHIQGNLSGVVVQKTTIHFYFLFFIFLLSFCILVTSLRNDWTAIYCYYYLSIHLSMCMCVCVCGCVPVCVHQTVCLSFCLILSSTVCSVQNYFKIRFCVFCTTVSGLHGHCTVYCYTVGMYYVLLHSRNLLFTVTQ